MKYLLLVGKNRPRPGRRTNTAQCFVLLLSFIILTPLSATQLIFDRIQLPGGLANNRVSSMVQDPSGMMWLGTENGLVLYNGINTVRFQHDSNDPNSLAFNNITDLEQDSNGLLWIATDGAGINSFNPADGVFTHNSDLGIDSINHEGVFDILIDHDGSLWLSSFTTVIHYFPDSGTHDVIELDTEPTSFLLDANGDLWLGGLATLLRYDRRHNLFIEVEGLFTDDEIEQYITISDLAQTDNGLIWIGTLGRGLRSYNPESGVISKFRHDMTTVESLASDDIFTLMADGNTLLIGTYDGLDTLDVSSGKITHHSSTSQTPGTLNHSYVNRIYRDLNAMIWVATYSGGLHLIRPEIYQAEFYLNNPTDPSTISSNNIHALTVDQEAGVLWIGTYDGYLNRMTLNDRKVTVIDPFSSMSSNRPRIWNIIKDPEGHLWLSTTRGIYHIDHNLEIIDSYRFDPTDENSLQTEEVWTSLITSDGTLLFGTAGGGVSIYQAETDNFRTYMNLEPDVVVENSIGDNYISSIVEDHNGRIWFSTYYAGLWYTDDIHADPPQFFRQPLQIDENATDFPINQLMIDKDNALWVASRGGSVYYVDQDASTVLHFTESSGIPSPFIRDLNEDESGDIWISSDHGLARFASRNHRFESVRLINDWNSRAYNVGAFERDENGEFWVGSQNGMFHFNPTHDAPEYVSPTVNISSITTALWSVVPFLENATVYEVPHTSQNITFDFNALQYFDIDLISYQYRLDGYEETWTQTGQNNRTARYTNLPPGNFTFEVRAKYATLDWGPVTRSASIIISPAPWNTPLAYLGYMIVLAGLLLTAYLIYRSRRKLELSHHAEIAEREQRLQLALWGSGDLLWDWSLEERRIYCPQLCEMLGVNEANGWVTDREYLEALHPDDQQFAIDQYTLMRNPDDGFDPSRHQINYQARLIDKDNHESWISVRGKVVSTDDDGKVLRATGTMKDVSENKRAETDRLLAARVLENLNDAVAILDLELRFISVNSAFERISGYRDSDIRGHQPDLLHSPRYPKSFRDRFYRSLHDDGKWSGEFWAFQESGQRFLCQLHMSMVYDETGQHTHYVAIFSDITNRKQAEDDLRHLANYDGLTGLPNRTLFNERLSHALIKAKRTDKSLSVIVFDLKQFKSLNESMGHLVGDMVLLKVAERLQRVVDQQDTVARLRSDEFAILLETVSGNDNLDHLLEHIYQAFDFPIRVNNRNLRLSPSIGVSRFPDHCDQGDTLVRNAYTALYQAKEGQNRQAVIYDPGESTVIVRQITLAEELATAVDRDELSIEYQPKVHPQTRSISGVEALIRWDHPEYGAIRPDEFIPIAEQRGLIFDIGQWVIRTSIEEMSNLRKMGFPPVPLAINVSPRQTESPEFVASLEKELSRHDYPGQLVQLELTEGLFLSHGQDTILVLEQLREIGIKIVIDDFGTGYSSLSYLNQLPIDHIKIDKSFVMRMESDKFSRAVIRAVIQMANSLSLAVTAEGIETEEQLQYLMDLGCNEVQGFLISQSLPLNALIEYLEKNASRPTPVRFGQ